MTVPTLNLALYVFVVTATGQLFDVVEAAINALVSSSAPALRFQCKRDGAKFIRVDASHRLSLHLSLHLPYTNSAGNCRLRVGVYRDDDRFGHAGGTASDKWENLTTEEYLPFIRIKGDVVWKQNTDELITGEQSAEEPDRDLEIFDVDVAIERKVMRDQLTRLVGFDVELHQDQRVERVDRRHEQ